MRKLYAVGTGPGASDLLTVRAVRAIESADVIFAPNNKGKNMALDSASEYIGDARVVMIDFPMGNVTEKLYEDNLKLICDELKDGECGVFLTIGDSTIYSTFINTLRNAICNDLEVELIPGIPAFLAGANAVFSPLVHKGENFVLCDDFDENLLLTANSIAILKTFKDKSHILEALEKHGFDYYYISNVSQDNQLVLTEKAEILAEENYMSMIIGRRW